MRRLHNLFLAALFVVVFSPKVGEAHHTHEHPVLVIGIPTEIPVAVDACWEVDGVLYLRDAARKSYESFDILYTLYEHATIVTRYGNRSILCGRLGGFFIPLEKISEEDIRGTRVTLFRFVAQLDTYYTGVPQKVELFGFTTSKLIPLEEYLRISGHPPDE